MFFNMSHTRTLYATYIYKKLWVFKLCRGWSIT